MRNASIVIQPHNTFNTEPGSHARHVHIFLLIPVRGSASYFTLPSREWRKDAMLIGPKLGCRFVERFKCRVGPSGPIRYAWMDEEGHVYGKEINVAASYTLYPGLIAGPVAIELGPFDREDPDKWDKFAAKLGRELQWRLGSGAEIVIPLPTEVPL